MIIFVITSCCRPAPLCVQLECCVMEGLNFSQLVGLCREIPASSAETLGALLPSGLCARTPL